jgi:serine phosphatase RsbU (regulator of sigma subunit)
MDFLTVTAADGTSFRHEMGARATRIGRSPGNDLVLDDPNVSRVHAEIVRGSEGCYLLDSGGKNGTFANDRRIDGPTLLRPGDRVRLGTTTLVFNGLASSRVRFSDDPLVQGAGTTILPAARSTPVPPARLPGSPGAEALAVVFEADRELVFHRALPEILETIMDLARRAVPFERGILMLLEDGRLVPQVVRVPPDEAGQTVSVSGTVTERVVRRQESVLTSDALADERFQKGQSVEAQQLRSVMCVPLRSDREVIGLIYVDSRRRAGLFTEESLRVLTHLANVAAVKIENARLFEQVVARQHIERELQRAAEIQRRLLPGEGPPIPGYEVYGSSTPCSAVGGDYYDYIALPGGRFALGLGDVAGKGLSAALLMCGFQSSLRALSDLDLRPEEMLVRLNRLLHGRIPENRFVTFFYALLDPVRHVLTYANAGQTAPLRFRPGTAVLRLPQTGQPLGFFENAAYGSAPLDMAPGDVLVCYSDGVTECRDGDDREFGEERLVHLVQESGADSPAGIAARITEAIRRHQTAPSAEDDVTLVVLKRTA